MVSSPAALPCGAWTELLWMQCRRRPPCILHPTLEGGLLLEPSLDGGVWGCSPVPAALAWLGEEIIPCLPRSLGVEGAHWGQDEGMRHSYHPAISDPLCCGPNGPIQPASLRCCRHLQEALGSSGICIPPSPAAAACSRQAGQQADSSTWT